MSVNPRILLGAMSGTSADGVDVAAAEITGRGLEMQAKYLAHVEHAYDAELRRRIFALRESGSCTLEELAKLGRDITLANATATRDLLKQMSLDPRQVEGLAAHGQTLFHAPPESIQWLDPALLAAETDLAVISDFRRADLAAGGQGAPLVPFADWILFRHPEKTRVILNLGGIANLTYLPAGGGIEDVIAFDTGPGCCIVDYLARTRRESSYDEGGTLAAGGKVVLPLVFEFAEHFTFSRKPAPKSLDTGEAIAAYENALASYLTEFKEPALASELATACAISAFMITAPWLSEWFSVSIPQEVFIAGGGTRNAALTAAIERQWLDFGETFALSSRQRVPTVETTERMGLPAQAREAVAFAILGGATLDNEPSNVPSATGARRRVVLGSITPRPVG